MQTLLTTSVRSLRSVLFTALHVITFHFFHPYTSLENSQQLGANRFWFINIKSTANKAQLPQISIERFIHSFSILSLIMSWIGESLDFDNSTRREVRFLMGTQNPTLVKRRKPSFSDFFAELRTHHLSYLIFQSVFNIHARQDRIFWSEIFISVSHLGLQIYTRNEIPKCDFVT